MAFRNLCLIFILILFSSCQDCLVYNITIKNNSDDLIYVEYNATTSAHNLVTHQVLSSRIVAVPKDSIYHKDIMLDDLYPIDEISIIHSFTVLKPATYEKYRNELWFDHKLCDGSYLYTFDEFKTMNFTFEYKGGEKE